ncbi:MAG: hypothetical protein JO166_14000 [Deltaproteobacteria bacterium]|nr:hypothetical protein [Deltaproteobacteria bacterium]
MLKVVEKQDGREAGEEHLLLEEIAREGARRMLMEALKAEVDDYVERHRSARDEQGHIDEGPVFDVRKFGLQFLWHSRKIAWRPWSSSRNWPRRGGESTWNTHTFRTSPVVSYRRINHWV